LGDNGFIAIIDALVAVAKTRSPASSVVDNNDINSNSCSWLGQLHLNASANGIGDRGVTHMVHAVLGDAEAEAKAEAEAEAYITSRAAESSVSQPVAGRVVSLPSFRTVGGVFPSLALADNRITDGGALLLCAMLTGAGAASAAADSDSGICCISPVDADTHEIDPLSECTQWLRDLDVSGNRVGKKGALDLVRMSEKASLGYCVKKTLLLFLSVTDSLILFCVCHATHHCVAMTYLSVP
jgi:hypothetical protein